MNEVPDFSEKPPKTKESPWAFIILIFPYAIPFLIMAYIPVGQFLFRGL